MTSKVLTLALTLTSVVSICSASETTNIYVIEYDSNLYMTMYGRQSTDDGLFGAFNKENDTYSNSTLQTALYPSSGVFSFLDSQETDDSYDVDEWYTSLDIEEEIDPSLDNGDIVGIPVGTADSIIFDSGSTYSTSGSRLYTLVNGYYTPSDDTYLNYTIAITQTDYAQDNMAFFAKATGYTLDDVGFWDVSDTFYTTTELTIPYDDDATLTFYAYEYSVSMEDFFGTVEQHYKIYIIDAGSRDIVEYFAAVSGEFEDDDLDDIYALITTGTSSGGDDLIELPGIPEPSTYALCFGILSVVTTTLLRSHNKRANKC
ncbi:hypothetical protein [Cerasicoccus frondis]|uniref:hypothetical protein n=1 Tax=Cerasicoccus frondis TaxID=490090 RepID=UPI002852A5BD|nr:hypothetical protein [Cerasicoccus frondis]